MPIRRVLILLVAIALLTAACSSSEEAADESPVIDPTSEPDTGDTEGAPSDTAEVVDAADGSDANSNAVEDAIEAPSEDAEPQYFATIRRTTNNVPHITADSFESVEFGYGFAFAEDHFCTLADVAVQVRSEASKYFGAGENDKWLDQDFVYLGLDLYERARVELDESDPTLRDGVIAYAAGANQYLNSIGAENVPGYCQGADWVQPISEYDLAAYFKVLTWEASIRPLIGFIADAVPPSPDEEALGTHADASAAEAAFGTLLPEPSTLGSNAWAIGPDRTPDGTTMLVGNPHFPWQGALRFYETHLTVPGELNVYGASLLGSPVINIGFNDDVAWSHTVSNGHRFTGYTLDLIDGDPTSYSYGDEERQMASETVSIEVRGEDGSIETVEHTLWFSHYGPVLSFPGVGWSDTRTITVRDANADNDEIIPQFFAMNQASSMDEFIGAHAKNTGIPWVNTVAASADGRIWYADTASTPNLSDEAIAAWQDLLETDPFTGIAYDNGFVLLDGSDPLFEWVDHPDARDPGVVPFSQMPQLERSDYLFNANDAYRWANPNELIPEASPLHGRLSAPSARTRMNATMLGTSDGGDGGDGLFTHDELRTAAFENRALLGELLSDEVVARCEATPSFSTNDVVVDLSKACEVLDDWDRHMNLDSRGAVIWREFLAGFSGSDFRDQGLLFGDAADSDDYVDTPAGLAPASDDSDLILANLANAVLTIEAAGFPLDVALGDMQFAYRGDQQIPIHGSFGSDGVTNAVGPATNATTSEPNSPRGEPVGDSALRSDGYPIARGTSFVYVLEFTAEGPVADAILTYGNSGDPKSEFFADQTQRFSDKDWRRVAFTGEAIEAELLREYTVSG